MLIVYIAGPYRADTVFDVQKNIHKALAMARALVRQVPGVGFLCPHANSALMDGSMPDEYWLDMTAELLTRCDCVLLCSRYWESEGATAEMKLAKSLGMLVFPSIDCVEKWAHTARPGVHRQQDNLAMRNAPKEEKGGLAAIVGKWPGDETDDEVRKAMEEVE